MAFHAANTNMGTNSINSNFEEQLQNYDTGGFETYGSGKREDVARRLSIANQGC